MTSMWYANFVLYDFYHFNFFHFTLQDDTMFVKSVSQGYYGRVTLNETGNIVTYIPDLDWSGVDNFTYIVSDGVNEVRKK